MRIGVVILLVSLLGGCKDEPSESQDSQSKAGESKDSQDKASESKVSESKDSQSKASESKASESKDSQDKDSQSKASEGKDSQDKASEGKASETSEQTTPSYTLEIDGIETDITAGTAINASVRVRQDGQELSGAKIETALEVVCGAQKYVAQQVVDDKGVATFAAFTTDNSWAGDCTATARAQVDKQDLTQSMTFTLSGVSQPPLIAGLEYAVNTLKDENGDVYNGFLSLGHCAGGEVLALTDDSNDPVSAGNGDGVAINSKKNWQYVIVGNPSPGCKLMLASSAGGTRREIRDVSVPPANDNVAQGKITALQKKTNKLVIATELVSGGSLYVYDHANNTWQGLSKVKWGGDNAAAINWSVRASDNRALLKVAQGSENWWYLAAAAMTVGEVRAGVGGGKLFSLSGVGTDTVAVQLDNACGLEVFRLTEYASSAALQEISTTALEITPGQDGKIKKFFARGNPTAGCSLSLKVGEVTVVATSTAAHDYPIMTLSRQSGADNILVGSNAKGMVKPLYVSNSGATGFDTKIPQWRLDTWATTNKQWNGNDASQNQGLAVHAGQEIFYARGK